MAQLLSPHQTAHRPQRRHRLSTATPWLLAAPALLLFLLVIAYPFAQSLIFGLYDKSLIGLNQTYVGLANVASLIADPEFWSVVGNTVIFVGGSTLGALVVAVGLAIALNSEISGKGVLRTALLLPWILPGVVVSFVWAWIFDSNYGLANGILYYLGVDDQIQWLDTPGLAMAAVITAKIWHSFPWMMIMILAALQSVPSETEDAAAVDGVQGWRKQAYVILPQIRTTIALVALLETIWGFQHFEIPFVMTDGGPVGSTTTLAVDLYKTAFQRFDIGMAGAIGILWTLLMAVLVTGYVLYIRRQERS